MGIPQTIRPQQPQAATVSRPALVLDALQHKWFVPVVLVLLVILALEMFLSARLESQTFDEPAHLYAGYSYWLRRDFGINPEHPPLVKLVAALPLLVQRPKYPEPMNFYFRGVSGFGGMQLLAAPGSGVLLDRARIAVSVFTFVLALLIVFSAAEMFGRLTALFALTLFVFDPLILAHGPLLGTDAGATCCIFAAIYAFYRYVKQPSLSRLALCGLAAGLALAAKHSAILILPLLLLLSVVELVLRVPKPASDAASPPAATDRTRYALRLGASFLAISAISLVILWATYGFRYQARPAGAQIIPSTADYLTQLHYPVERRLLGFAERHHLLPEAYLYGLTDVTVLSREGRVMFLFGRIYPEGRWFYFPAAFLVKSTLAFLLLLALVPFAIPLWRRGKRREVAFLALPAIVYFGFAMTAKLDIGIRHVMPVMPFLIVLAGAAAVTLAAQSRVWAWAVSVLLLLHMASSAHAFPNYLPYSNEVFGGPSGTHRFLADSNVGWGGGLKALHAYLEKEHITDCWFAYSAIPDPRSFNIPCRRLPTFFSGMADQGQQQPVPQQIQGPLFISSEEVDGSLWSYDESNPYHDFRRMRPSLVIAGEILRYDGTFSIQRVAALSHCTVANALLRRQRFDEALAHAQTAVALDPSSLLAHEILAFAYVAHRQPQDAQREYQMALHLYQTVHPEFMKDEFPPQDPLRPPPSQ